MESSTAADHAAAILDAADNDISFAEALGVTAELLPAALATFRASIDPAWIEEALLATGTATVRRRRLPAEQVIWLVLGMALMRNVPIAEIVRRLDLALPDADGSRTVAPSAVSQARARLGAEPLEWLFHRTADAWASHGAVPRWRDLALVAADGTTLRVADSDENRAHFGSQAAGANRGTSGYPLVRLVTVMAVRTHLLLGASFGPYAHGECAYARALLDIVPEKSLVLLDRGYLQADVLVPLVARGHNWLTRTKTTTKYTVIQRLGPGDELVEMAVSREARRKDPSLPATFRARIIQYQRKGFTPKTLLTSLLDPKRFPAAELRVIYHERWEIELGFGEIKTDLLDRMETIRSKSPETVAQELWGLLLAYNLVRLEMMRLAADLRVDPTRISFVAAVREIVREWYWNADTPTPGAIPKRLASMRDNIRVFVLPPRRPERLYPRAVKIKMSNYARKRPPTRTRRK
jgi:Insertion element 4 transposase N-terminal/Transposase DDE domain